MALQVNQIQFVTQPNPYGGISNLKGKYFVFVGTPYMGRSPSEACLNLTLHE